MLSEEGLPILRQMTCRGLLSRFVFSTSDRQREGSARKRAMLDWIVGSHRSGGLLDGRDRISSDCGIAGLRVTTSCMGRLSGIEGGAGLLLFTPWSRRRTGNDVA